MLIINADDFGRSREETDAALRGMARGRLTSATAMVFMDDSQRAADLARAQGVRVGLHLNLSQRFASGEVPLTLRQSHERIVEFMLKSKYAMHLFHPGLQTAFREVFQAQYEEFCRLFGEPPTHVDGHQHRHHCANMVLGGVIPRGVKVRRNFSFFKNEKSFPNRAYRSLVDSRLARRYQLTDYFFALSTSLERGTVARAIDLAGSSDVELMTHPVNPVEYDWLMSDECADLLKGVTLGSYAELGARQEGAAATGSHDSICSGA